MHSGAACELLKRREEGSGGEAKGLTVVWYWVLGNWISKEGVRRA